MIFISLLFSISILAAPSENSAFATPISTSNQQSTELAQNLERIVVTASRSKTALLTTPASVTRINQDVLELINHQHINQSLGRVAGTWISRGNGQEHLTALRSPVLTGAGGCGAFFMALDNISLRSPGFCNANQLFDTNSEQAQSIEVLRGPASTLYGSNAVHGVINVLSPDAFSSEPNYTSLRLGRDDHAKVSVAYRAQSDDSAFGVFSNITQNNGYQQNSGYDQQKLSVVYERKGDVWQNKTLMDLANLNQETAGFVQGFEIFKDKQTRRTNPNPEAYRDAKSLRAYSKFSRDLGQGQLSLTPFLRWNEMAFLQHFLPWKALEENKHASIGLQAQYRYTKNNFTLITGVDTDFTSANLKETQAQDFSPSIPAGDHYNYDVDASQIGTFAQAEWQLDNFLLTVGARAEQVSYDYNNLLADGSACTAEVETCRFSRPPDQNVNFMVFSPTLSVLYALTPQQSLYVKATQGFRAPQASELFRLQNNQLNTNFEEEKIDALELAWRFFTDNVALSTTLFMQQKSNFIFQDADRQNIANGETQHKGIELSAKFDMSDTLYLSTNLSYANHEYTNEIELARISIKGNEIDTAPRTLGSVQLGWQVNPDLMTELSVQHTGNYYLNPENTAQYSGHNLIDINLRYTHSPQLVISATILNLLDEDYAERADFGFGSYRYFVGQPRRLLVSAIWQWAQ
jgi:outer membrane receptor protein involved in Fe transport